MEKSKGTGIGFFEKHLTIWVALCMVVGVLIGKLLPGIIGNDVNAIVGDAILSAKELVKNF